MNLTFLRENKKIIGIVLLIIISNLITFIAGILYTNYTLKKNLTTEKITLTKDGRVYGVIGIQENNTAALQFFDEKDYPLIYMGINKGDNGNSPSITLGRKDIGRILLDVSNDKGFKYSGIGFYDHKDKVIMSLTSNYNRKSFDLYDNDHRLRYTLFLTDDGSPTINMNNEKGECTNLIGWSGMSVSLDPSHTFHFPLRNDLIEYYSQKYSNSQPAKTYNLPDIP